MKLRGHLFASSSSSSSSNGSSSRSCQSGFPKDPGQVFFSSTLSDPSQMEVDLRAVDLYQLSVCHLMDSAFKTIHCGANTPGILVSLWDAGYHSHLPLHIGDLQTEL